MISTRGTQLNQQKKQFNKNGKRLPKINIDLVDRMSEGDISHDSINSFNDDPDDFAHNYIVQDDIEVWATRYAELYRLKVAQELVNLN